MLLASLCSPRHLLLISHTQKNIIWGPGSSLFVLSFIKTSRYWCHSLSVLQSVKQRHGTAVWKKEEQVKKFVLFMHKSCRFPQSFFFFLHCNYLFALSILSLHLPYQGKVRPGFFFFAIWISNTHWVLKCATNRKVMFANLLSSSLCFFFFPFLMETNPWQVERKEVAIYSTVHILYHFTLSVKVKVETWCSFNLVLVLDNNITAVLLFVAAAAQHVYGPWSPLRGKKTRLFWMKWKNLGAQPCKLICSCCMMGTQLASLTCAQQIIIAFFSLFSQPMLG